MSKRGFCQDRDGVQHTSGKNGHFKIGLVKGQFGDMSQTAWRDAIADIGFDGCELDTWNLELQRCKDDPGAKAYAEELLACHQERGLEIFTLSAHLQGQALGDEPSLKTLQFVGGEALKAYTAWREAGNEPPRTNPYYVPEAVASLIHVQAERDLLATVRLAYHLGQLQGRHVVVTAFVGSPAHCWSHWFLFPPLPVKVGGYTIPNVRKVSLELMIERFKPIFDECVERNVRFGLECHPGEVAMGDIASAWEFIDAVHEAGYGDIVGFNYDASHMYWQGVCPVEFIRQFAEHIFSVHIKGVQVVGIPTMNGRLGGHQPMGDSGNGWNFVTACSQRDSLPEDAIVTELKRIGFEGALCVECEDSAVEQWASAKVAFAGLRAINLPPSLAAHDANLKA